MGVREPQPEPPRSGGRQVRGTSPGRHELGLPPAFVGLRRARQQPFSRRGCGRQVRGFLNVSPFVYSFVADHFQHLASLGIISLFSAGVTLLLKPRSGSGWSRTGRRGHRPSSVQTRRGKRRSLPATRRSSPPGGTQSLRPRSHTCPPSRRSGAGGECDPPKVQPTTLISAGRDALRVSAPKSSPSRRKQRAQTLSAPVS